MSPIPLRLLRTAVVICCLASLALSQTTTSIKTSATDDAALRRIAADYFSAYAQKDVAAITGFWSAQAPELAARKQALMQAFNNVTKIELQNFNVLKVTFNDEHTRALVRVAAQELDTPQSGGATKQSKLQRTLEFVKEADTWKVVRDVAAEEELAGALVLAKTAAERQSMLAAQPELLTSELLMALNLQARRFAQQGNFPQALNAMQIMLGLAEQLGDKENQARALNNIGAIYRSQENYAEALANYQKSLAISEALGHKMLMSRAQFNIGVMLYERGDLAQALRSYQQALLNTDAIGDKPMSAQVLNTMGIIYHVQGNYAHALEVYQRSLQLSETLGDKEGVANALNNIGLLHYSQGNGAQALDYFQRSLKLEEELGDKPSIANTLGNIGLAYRLQGNYNEALASYQKGLALDEASGNKRALGTTLNNIGTIYSLQHDYAKAREYYQKSLELKEAIGDREDAAETLSNLSKDYYAQGQFQSALEAAKRAVELARQVGIPDTLWQALVSQGRAYRALNQSAQAQTSFTEAISTVEALRTQVAGDEQTRQRFFENKVEPYREMVDLMVAQNNMSEALVYAERAKARVLLDVIHSGRTDIDKATTAEERAREQQLNSQLVTLNKQLMRARQSMQPDQAQLGDLKARLMRARLDYESFQTNLYAAHPELKVQRGEAQPINLTEARALLPDTKSALLEFVETESKFYLFVLTKTGAQGENSLNLKVYPLILSASELSLRAEHFRQLLAARSLDFRQPAQELYNLLLKPAREQLQGKSTLVIVPDGALWELPFQALQSAPNHYLLEDYAIAYAPSLTVLGEMERARKQNLNHDRATTTLLAVGNPTINKQTAARAQSVLMGESLEPLPESEKQVIKLGELYGAAQSRVYVGENALEERVKAEANSYRILQLATHGVLNDSNPMYSYVVLSQADSSREDGLLEAWEMMKLDLRADLVVLSACETARGHASAGEGMIGMSWALFVAGSPTTVVSQWKVESASTTALMLEFHRNLKALKQKESVPMAVAKAMQRASVKLLQGGEYQHPFYWAGFVVVGSAN